MIINAEKSRYSEEFYNTLNKCLLKAAEKFKSELEKIPIEQYDFLVSYTYKENFLIKGDREGKGSLNRLIVVTNKLLRELEDSYSKSENDFDDEEDEEIIEMSNNAEATVIDLEDKENKEDIKKENEGLEEQTNDI